MKTLKDLWPSLENSVFSADYSYPTCIEQADKALINSLLSKKFSTIVIAKQFAESTSLLKAIVSATLLSKNYTIEGLKKTLEFEYNPIHNYDRTEQYTDVKGEQHNSFSKGSETVTNNNGQQKTTNVSGSTSSHSLTTNSTTGFNSDDDLVDNISDTSTTSNQVTDTSTQDAYTDSSSMSARTDASTDGSRTDTRNAHISGNIGVMSTQQMIEAEREVVLYDWYDFLCNLIIDAISIGIWASEDLDYEYYYEGV